MGNEPLKTFGVVMHRFTSSKGVELIKYYEGFKAQPYVCSGGYLTIGFGHRLLPSDRFKKITIKQAEKLLLKDLLSIERNVIKYINVNISDDQFAALVSFTFNLGPAALQRSTLRQKINYGALHDASTEFLKWVYAGGQKSEGLVRRRKSEKMLFVAGILNF